MKLGKAILIAIPAALVAGTLDLTAAVILAWSSDSGPVNMLQTIASGPFGARAFDGFRFIAIGLVVHFAIMGCMALAYMLAASRIPFARARPLLAGALYGLVLWAFMSLVVLPLRWPGRPIVPDVGTLIATILAHVVLVGMPIGLIYAWANRPAKPPAIRQRRSEPTRAPRR